MNKEMGRILLLSLCAPLPATGGDRQRTDLLYRALQLHGSVDLLLYRDFGDVDGKTLELLNRHYQLKGQQPRLARGQRGRLRWLRTFAPELIDRLAHNLGRTRLANQADKALQQRVQTLHAENPYDLIVCRYLPSALALGDAVNIPVLVDVDDNPIQVYQRRLSQEPLNAITRAVVKRHLYSQQRWLPHYLAGYQHVWVANPSDTEGFNLNTVSVLPNIPYQSQLQAKESANKKPCLPNPDPRRIAFAGSLNYDVNLQGLTYFLDEVWPIVHRSEPNAQFSIYGAGISDGNRASWNALPGVQVEGFVDDIRTAYADNSFNVVPTFTGGGSKIKVLEALSYGRTCVLTSHALRGFEHALEHNRSVLVADTAQGIADACLTLINNEAQRDELAENGKNQVNYHFSVAHFNECVSLGIQAAQKQT